jgi:hypothetical protein
VHFPPNASSRGRFKVWNEATAKKGGELSSKPNVDGGVPEGTAFALGTFVARERSLGLRIQEKRCEVNNTLGLGARMTRLQRSAAGDALNLEFARSGRAL